MAAHMSSLMINSHTLVSRDKRAAVAAFLLETLAGGEVEVAVIESRARAAGLLSERQKIEHAKLFKEAKRMLGIRSRRIGFGRDGRWVWRLETSREVTLENPDAPTRSDSCTGPADVVDHSRPKPATYTSDRNSTEPGRIPSEWRDGFTILEIRPAPRDVPVPKWNQIVNDCRRFLSSPWAARAYKLGWSTLSLFGCTPTCPLHHLGSAGLVWHLCGGKLTRLSKEWALILTPDGTEHVFDRHRRRLAIATTLPWMLP
jgi:hypothetical protein